QVLKQGGFQPNPLSESVDATARPFPQLFARNARFDGAPQTPTPKDFEIGPLVYELALQQPPASTPVAPAAEPWGSPIGRLADSPRWSLPVDERFLWLAMPVAGALLLFLLLLLPLRWLAWRRQRHGWVAPRAANNAVVVDFATAPQSPAALNPGSA